MSSSSFDIGNTLERLFSNRRVVIGGLSVGGLIVVCSLALGTFGAPRHRKSVAVLPDAPLNVPILRQLPYPEPRKTVVVPRGGSTVTAQR